VRWSKSKLAAVAVAAALSIPVVVTASEQEQVGVFEEDGKQYIKLPDGSLFELPDFDREVSPNESLSDSYSEEYQEYQQYQEESEEYVAFKSEVVDVERLRADVEHRAAQAKEAKPEEFEDLAGHYAVGIVSLMNQMGYVDGKSDGGFHPYDSVTRGEFAALLSRAFALEVVDSDDYSAYDAEGHWAEHYLTSLEELGVLERYEDGYWHPDFEVTNQEAVDAISELVDFPKNRYVDPEWASEYGGSWDPESLQKAATLGLVSESKPGSQYSPEHPVSRVDLVVALFRCLSFDSVAYEYFEEFFDQGS